MIRDQRDLMTFLLGAFAATLFFAFCYIWLPTVPLRIVSTMPTPTPTPGQSKTATYCSNDGGHSYYPC